MDNHSTDGSKSYLEGKFPTVVFKWNEKNVGFARANNEVLKDARGSVILFLNPDTIVPEDCFEKCLAFINSNDDCGALGVRMIDGAGSFLKESKRSIPTPMASFFKMAGLAKLFPSSAFFSKYYAGHLPEQESNIVDVLAGAFLMIRKKVLDKTGGFDEAFFMYAEDIDLSYRVQKEGYKNYFFTGTTIIHFKGESTQRESKSYITRFYGAMQLFVAKHYRDKKAIAFLMTLAITVGKMLAFIKLYGKKYLFASKKKIALDGRETIVIADQPYFNEMIQLIKHAKDPLLIQGRVSLDVNDRFPSTGSIDDIQNIVKKNCTSVILFCEDPLALKTMIGIMELLKGQVDFLFHAKGSQGIVGSSDKHDNGIIISGPL